MPWRTDSLNITWTFYLSFVCCTGPGTASGRAHNCASSIIRKFGGKKGGPNVIKITVMGKILMYSMYDANTTRFVREPPPHNPCCRPHPVHFGQADGVWYIKRRLQVKVPLAPQGHSLKRRIHTWLWTTWGRFTELYIKVGHFELVERGFQAIYAHYHGLSTTLTCIISPLLCIL